MDDIIERLCGEQPEGGWKPVREEAAAEISRLRTLLAERDHTIEMLRAPQQEAQPAEQTAGELARPTASGPAPTLPNERSFGMVTPMPPLPRVMTGTPVWIADGEIFPAEGQPGIGFRCRNCGTRIKQQRHIDPRLLCSECVLLPVQG
jgi:hypothetical protein